jgi:predicted porin
LEIFVMKKSLVALAVLAASGAAMAQSSVTLYGIADVWVGNVKIDTGATSTSTTAMVSGGVSTSRWGMKGSEDLGGGLKANFNLEQGVSIDTGAGSGFTRKAWVGLSGDFGHVRLGLMPTVYDDYAGVSDSIYNSDLSPAQAASGYPGSGVFRTNNDYSGKVGNTVGYFAPAFVPGLTAGITYSLAEDSNGLPAGATAITSFGVGYAKGPIGAEFAYQKQDVNNSSNDLVYTRLGGSYNFGVATAKLLYGKVDHAGANAVSASTILATANGKTTEWQIGVDVPMSAALTLSGGYAASTDNASVTPANGEAKRTGFGLAAVYSLSKRTTVYGGLKSLKLDNGSATDTDIKVYAVGVKHTF